MSEPKEQKPQASGKKTPGSIWQRIKNTGKRGLIFIGSLIFVLILFPIIIPKVEKMFPDITTTGWIILFMGFGITTAVGIKASEMLEKRFDWSEDRATYVSIIVFLGGLMLLAWYFWPHLEPWFGKMHRD